MSEHLSGVDDAQLERWAYGRAATPADQERAALATAELHRRAAIERERVERAEADRAAAAAHTLAVVNGDVDEAASEHPESTKLDDERRHRRRMLATGIAGVAAAVLALVGGVAVLNQPNPDPDPDPLAIFEREETQLDRDWQARLESWGYSPITAGPRAIEVDEGYVVIAARISTVPDGRSTEWDSYCLFVASPAGDDGSWGLSPTCTYPEKFEREGLTVLERSAATGSGFDVATWGPASEPRFVRSAPLNDELDLDSSLLDAMSPPRPLDAEPASMNFFGEPDLFLMGPVVVPLLYEGEAARVFGDKGLVATVFLISGERPTDSPKLCVLVAVSEENSRLPCSALPTARREGLEARLTVDGRTLKVTIAPDGPNRTDTVRLLD